MELSSDTFTLDSSFQLSNDALGWLSSQSEIRTEICSVPGGAEQGASPFYRRGRGGGEEERMGKGERGEEASSLGQHLYLGVLRVDEGVHDLEAGHGDTCHHSWATARLGLPEQLHN